MPELYDNVRRANSQYVPQFIGSNADTLRSVGDQLEARNYRNQVAIEDKMQASLDDQYARGDEHIGQDIYNRLNTLRENIASSEKGFENSSAVVRNSVRDNYTNNRLRIEAQRNFERESKFEDKLNKIGASNAEVFGAEFTGTANEDGSFNRFDRQVEERLDWDKRKESFYNDFRDKLSQGEFKIDPNNPDFLRSVITQGITSNRIATYANDALSRYKGTAEYEQEKKVILRGDSELTQAQVDDVIKMSIVATGMERAGVSTKLDLQQRSQYALKGKYEQPEPETPLDRGRTQYFKNPNLPPNPFEGVEFDESENVKVAEVKGTPFWAGRAGQLYSWTKMDSEKETEKVKNNVNELKDTNETNRNLLGDQFSQEFAASYDLSKSTDKEIVEIYNKAYNDVKSLSGNPIRPSTDILDVTTEQVVPTIQDRRIYVLDSGGKPTQDGSYQAAMNELELTTSPWYSNKKSITEEGVAKTGKIKITGIQPFNPYNDNLSGGFLGTITDGKGLPRTILIEADQTQTALFARSQSAAKARMTGQRQILDNTATDGLVYESIPVINKNTKKFDIYIRKYDSKGNPVGFIDADNREVPYVTSEDITEMDIDRFTKSGLLKSNLGATKNTSVE